MKPNLLIRRGNRFVFDKTKVLPYMGKNMDLINAAITAACQDVKINPDKYKGLDNIQKLDKMNELVYAILEKWNIYKP